jgi:hypothetical protein
MIKNLGARLACRYKIKIGGLGKETTSKQGTRFRLPEKYDHFVITTNERDPFGNLIPAHDIMQAYGPKPTELNVILFSNEIEDVYNDWYAYYTGKSVQCKSIDGEIARWNHMLAPLPQSLQQIQDENGWTLVRCTGQQCPVYQKENCKINAIFRCILAEAQTVGGVAELRTTSINSALQLRASLALIQQVTGGYMAGIPLILKLQPKTVQLPQGGQSIIYITHLEYPGSLLDLKQIALEYQKKIALMDKDLRLVAASAYEETPEEIAHVVEEFYPQNSQGQAVPENIQPGCQEVFTPIDNNPETEQPATASAQPVETSETASTSPFDLF